jgi:ATP-dependent Clp protease protease subunit
MGSILLTGGAKGKRYAVPNARIMIHQPHGGARGQATDIQIQAEEILRTRRTLCEIYVETTGQSFEVIDKAIERDNFMSAEQAKVFGLIDEVIFQRPSLVAE